MRFLCDEIYLSLNLLHRLFHASRQAVQDTHGKSMTRKFILVILSAAILASTPIRAEQATTCLNKELQKNQVDSIIERRATTFKHCLVCSGKSCQLKTWPPTGADFAQACKVLFCTPLKIPRSALAPANVNANGASYFTYAIDKNGRTKDINITDASGGLTLEAAQKLAETMFRRRIYEPIIHDGQAYELTNLKHSMRLTMRPYGL